MPERIPRWFPRCGRCGGYVDRMSFTCDPTSPNSIEVLTECHGERLQATYFGYQIPRAFAERYWAPAAANDLLGRSA